MYSVKIHDMLIDLAQRNYGIKDLKNFVRLRYAYGKDKTENFARYEYLMLNNKKSIDMTSRLLMNNLLSAQSIYPTTMAEWEQRRALLNAAIGNCHQLIFSIQEIVKIFDVDINIFDSFQSAIDREIDLIKKWRQRDNKIKSCLKG